jgi:hypothetical protein
MIAGSTDIIVDVAPVERSDISEMPDRQFWGDSGNAGCLDGRAHEPLQQSFYGNTLPPRLAVEAGLGFV